MKSIVEYITEAKNGYNLKLSDEQLDVLYKVFFEMDLDEFENEFKRNECDDLLAKYSPVKNQLDIYKKMDGRGKLGYWRRENISEFTKLTIEKLCSFIAIVTSLSDKLSKKDTNILLNTMAKCYDTIPQYKGLTYDELYDKVEPILQKHRTDKARLVVDKNPDMKSIIINCVSLSPDAFNALVKDLENIEMDNTVIGDSFVDSIYIKYIDKK